MGSEGKGGLPLSRTNSLSMCRSIDRSISLSTHLPTYRWADLEALARPGPALARPGLGPALARPASPSESGSAAAPAAVRFLAVIAAAAASAAAVRVRVCVCVCVRARARVLV